MLFCCCVCVLLLYVLLLLLCVCVLYACVCCVCVCVCVCVHVCVCTCVYVRVCACVAGGHLINFLQVRWLASLTHASPVCVQARHASLAQQGGQRQPGRWQAEQAAAAPLGLGLGKQSVSRVRTSGVTHATATAGAAQAGTATRQRFHTKQGTTVRGWQHGVVMCLNQGGPGAFYAPMNGAYVVWYRGPYVAM